MKAKAVLLSLAALFSVIIAAGCIQPVEEYTFDNQTTTFEESTTTTLPETTTTHQLVQIKNMTLSRKTSTTLNSLSTTYTTSTSSTSTTYLLALRNREYVFAGNMSFYLTDIEDIAGTTYYTFEYNTTDGKWDQRTIQNATLIDGLEFGIYNATPYLTPTAYLKESESVKKTAPKAAEVFMLGAGLTDREYFGFLFTFDSLHTDMVKVWIGKGNRSVLTSLSYGGVAYYKDLEVGVLNPRISGGYALLYTLNDREQFNSLSGSRYCLRGADYLSYQNATVLLLNSETNTTYGNMTLAFISQDSPKIIVYYRDFHGEFPISCGSTVTVFGKKVRLLWTAQANKATAKVLVTA